MKKSVSPQTPYREKAKGKEIRRVFCSNRLSCARGRVSRVSREIAAVVEEAIVAFGGTRGPNPSDEAIWAGIAWRIGAERFHYAVMDKLAEDRCDNAPRKRAATFQAFLDRHFPKGGAR